MKFILKSFLIYSIFSTFCLNFTNCKPSSFNKSGIAGETNLLETYQAEINELQTFLNVDKAAYLASVHMQNLNRNTIQNAAGSEFYAAMTPSFFYQKYSSDPAIQDSNLLPEFLRKREKEAGGNGQNNGVLEKEISDFSNAFSIKPRSEIAFTPALFPDLIEPEDSSVVTVPQLPTGELETQYALNIQDYVANRMTRGVFWDVNHSNRDLEFHIGLYREFFDRVSAKGGSIIGEVKTAAANYNKIYIVKYPDKNHLTYAIAPISGQDRLTHILYHLAVAQASLPGSSADSKVVQYGETNSYLERTEKDFILWLKRRPKADITLIGQKMGLEKIFSEMASKNNITVNFKSGEFSSSMFDAADLSYKNKNGKTGLIRVISNV